ncbi:MULTISPECIES: hypothetical protein [unclassified Azospirillum]|uniref:hypothetical protein n=1 Tax=unclassified Azospirillum TaxID=2630922 RepID=UPI000B64FEF4|nr:MULTISPECIES: hypothetical protein [unclassified Azospirillum]SNS57219.1 hypothetical protein SAMN05880556_107120 [Azospirillum sp. RU38E]SNS76982.1 hypothetical protein SAMN05880591_107120 [Azospirillum sp. RU37A]
MRRSSLLTRAALVILIAALFPFAASAAECDDYSLSWSKAPKAGTVKADQGPRLHFQRVEAGCPGSDTCKAKAYLVPGDKVILDDTGETWICAYFQGPKRGTFGWLPRTALAIEDKPPVPRKQDWVGRWRVGENLILIDDTQGPKLHFEGWARRMATFSLSMFEFTKSPSSNKVIDKSGGGTCVVKIYWLAELLLVNNTMDCAGLGNSFIGVYRRTALTTDPKAEH